MSLLLIFWASQTVAMVFSPSDIATLRSHFFANFSPQGAIVASPSQYEPNYYYDWIRDSAIAMDLVETWYERDKTWAYKARLYQYVEWTKKVQSQAAPLPGYDILGEPKFYIDGYPFDGAWGRPQNDGPALRATVLTHFALNLLNTEAETEYVTSHLYHGGLDPQTMGVIKMDLEYIAHHWQDANFDLWEEVFGHHFFTAMVQQRALYEGAQLARRLNDEQAALFYEHQASQITARLKQHLDHENKVIQATLPPHNGPQKSLELDSAVILALLLNPQHDNEFALNHRFVSHTVHALHQQFNAMFPINQQKSGAILFGRYPGDSYDGYQTHSTGNPWFVLTAMMAEYHFTLANQLPFSKKNKSLINQQISIGDSYLKLIKHYAPNLYMDEQINLNTGKQQGAASLTWSYVAVLRAIDLRLILEKKLR